MQSMYEGEGIGLAAPQVGILKRMFVMDVREEESEPRVIVNPAVVELEGRERDEEGCLSLPGLTGMIERPAQIVMEGQGLSGDPMRIETSGLEARCIQHEIDHLNGVLIIDRVSPIKRRMLLSKWKKLQKEAAAK